MDFYKLLSTCKVVEGYKRNAIYDLQKETIYFVPKLLSKHIKNKIFTLEFIRTKIPMEHYKILLDLISREYFVTLNNKKQFRHFQGTKVEFDEPNQVSNAIIYINQISNTIPAISKLVSLGCYYFQLVFTCEEYLPILNYILKETLELPILSYEIIIAHTIQFKKPKYDPRILRFIYFGSLFDKINLMNNITPVIYLKKEFSSKSNISKIKPQHLSINIQLFNETHYYNNYFNRKVVIKENGDIKNYYSQSEYFGNINKDELSTIIKNNAFQALWHITKDQILPCKYCELRFSCVDERVPVKNGKTFSFQTNCNYNPFETKWIK